MKHVSINDIVDIKPRRPSATTRERGWDGVTVDFYPAFRGCSASYPALDHHVVSYCPSGHARFIQKRGGLAHEGSISKGVSLIMPAGYDSCWDGDAAASARIRIPTSLVTAAGEQIGRKIISQIEIRNIFETRDTTIESLALVLLAELERDPHPAQALIFDQISCALGAHLLRSYNASGPAISYGSPSLGWRDLARLTEFIEDNIDRSIGLADLAAIVSVSRFHFARIFKRSTGMTAISFVEQCRLRRAQSLIRDTRHSLAEIALMTGFADQSHFTRRFRRRVGSTPAAFAREHGRWSSERR
jgi:AraC family transcriptional regulator